MAAQTVTNKMIAGQSSVDNVTPTSINLHSGAASAGRIFRIQIINQSTNTIYVNLNGSTATASYTDNVVLGPTTTGYHTLDLDGHRPTDGRISMLASGAASNVIWRAYYCA